MKLKLTKSLTCDTLLIKDSQSTLHGSITSNCVIIRIAYCSLILSNSALTMH